METIHFTLNASKDKTKPKKARYKGRDYLVAPMTMIVPGVLPGSQGPVLYPATVVNQGVDRWNGMPIVVYHPKDKDGNFITARQPDVLDAQSIGEVYNSRFADKLTAEGWFDVERTKEVDIRVYNALVKGEKIELSTGLFGIAVPVEDKDTDKAIHNGKAYKATLTAYVPDHLAVLPDEAGACSLKDGCGVMVNEELVLTDNELDHSQVREAIYLALRSQLKQSDPYCYVLFVYDDYFVYEQGNQYYRQGYTKSDTGVTLSDKKPVKVMREVSFVPVGNESKDTHSSDDIKGEQGMALTDNQRKEHVSFICANCSCWKGQDEVVTKFSDDTLVNLKTKIDKDQNDQVILNAVKEGFGTIVPTEIKAKAELFANSQKKDAPTPVTIPQTPIQNQTPMLSDKDREYLEFGKAEMDRRKADLVGRIVANVADANKKATLATMYSNMSIPQLEDVLLTIPQVPAPGQSIQMPTVNGVPIPDYSGQGGGFLPTGNTRQQFTPGEPLKLEVMSFGDTK